MLETFQSRDIIGIEDFSKEDILYIIECAQRFKDRPDPTLLSGTLMGSCFFEPSTRTRISFESAMHRLGGSVVGFSDAGVTSAVKGESLHDTMKMMEGYVDVVVLRHPCDGAAQWAADSVTIPVINAGDGVNQHPTQTLLDLYTIKETQGTLENLSLAMVGDLKFGRTCHSLVRALAHFNVRLYFVSSSALEMPKEICNSLRENGIKFSFHKTIEEVLPKVDILYMTRIQEERFADRIEYEHVKSLYSLQMSHLVGLKENFKILHPLPRVHEIDLQIDSTPYAYYFQQAHNGLYVRQALLGLVLGKI